MEPKNSGKHSVRFIDSYQKHKLLVVDGFIYQLNSVVKRATYFKCNRRIKGCRASAIIYNLDRETYDYTHYKVPPTSHSHQPNPEKIRKHEVNTVSKDIVSENVNLRTCQVIEEVSNKFISTPDEAVVTGKISHLKRHIRNARRRITGERRIGTCREDFILPIDLQCTRGRANGDEETFLLEDMPGPNRTLVFATKPMLQILADDCSVWLMDGTFKLSPDWFSQVFTIHAIYMGTCIPFVYSLLPLKKSTDYGAVSNAVTTSGIPGGFNPDYIIADFELGIIKACRENFPHIKIHGCMFHLCQSVYRRVQTSGLTEMYTNNKVFRNAIRSLSALAFRITAVW